MGEIRGAKSCKNIVSNKMKAGKKDEKQYNFVDDRK